MQKYIIDRFEEDFAVCENYDTEEIIDILKEKLPNDAKEGDILLKDDNENFCIDYEETKLRKERMEILRKSLKKNKEN